MIGPRGTIDTRISDGLIRQRLIVHLDRNKAPVHRAACKYVVEHLRAALVNNTEPTSLIDRLIEHDQGGLHIPNTTVS